MANLNLLRARRTAPSLTESESNLLIKINEGFPAEKWARLVQLDEKLEFSEMTEDESKEHLTLAEALEAYTVQRFIWLKQLASLRNVSVEQVMKELDITPK